MRLGLLLVLSATIVAIAAASEDCRSLGFAEDTTCSDCDSLGSYVKDAELLAECKRCCTKDNEQDTRTYKAATLQVCPYRLNGLPHINDFIEKHAKAYKRRGLKVSLKQHAHPSIVLGAVGEDKVTVRIDNWKAAHIMEYLDDKLQPRT